MVNIADRRFAPLSRTGSPLGRMLTVINCPNTTLRYLILDCPTESTLDFYMEEFAHLNVTSVVRCCQPTYNAARLAERKINVIDLPFKDGGVPSPYVIREWLQLVEKTKEESSVGCLQTIAVHCVAGLGRAPVLVAIALIEMGMKPLDAIEFIRSKRRGSFNKPQIAYLDSYKRSKPKSANNYSLRSSLGRMFKIGGGGSGGASKAASTVSQQI
ncbi:protein-tyrosine phosphatase-like protein [Radiomyces spectabilis]|uniref:protein-tyrosine phosphatase-like protein n=1 Tax=Radiomyces spectabilis TaxID=64574 RepID=UPI00221EE72A|nr:protein-tyrosine phosphatase-like protein [Radiomyces spectabilis]KAI8366814.1 protein-tyrosine phosphatase-like protein [Radiomyces spectabilis]